jgi:hypothetical protein
METQDPSLSKVKPDIRFVKQIRSHLYILFIYFTSSSSLSSAAAQLWPYMALPDEIWVHLKSLSWTVQNFPLSMRNFTRVTCLSARLSLHLTFLNPSNKITGLTLKQATTSTFIIILPFDTIFFSPHGSTAPSGPEPPHYRGFTITLRHTTVGRTPLDKWSAWRRDLYLTTHNTHKRQTSMPPAGFETIIPASEQPQTHALDRKATGIGFDTIYLYK